MSIVSNTGPLIALAKLDLLSILRLLFTQIDVPEAVRDELFAKPTAESQRIAAAIQSGIIRVHVVSLQADEHHSLGRGEAQAIALASQLSQTLLIDDRVARRIANSRGVFVTGTIGVLVEAKRIGQLASVRETLYEIRARGYWFSDALIQAAAESAGE